MVEGLMRNGGLVERRSVRAVAGRLMGVAAARETLVLVRFRVKMIPRDDGTGTGLRSGWTGGGTGVPAS